MAPLCEAASMTLRRCCVDHVGGCDIPRICYYKPFCNPLFHQPHVCLQWARPNHACNSFNTRTPPINQLASQCTAHGSLAMSWLVLAAVHSRSSIVFGNFKSFAFIHSRLNATALRNCFGLGCLGPNIRICKMI